MAKQKVGSMKTLIESIRLQSIKRRLKAAFKKPGQPPNHKAVNK